MKKILAIGCGGAGMFSLVVASQLKKGKFETKVLSDEKDIYCRCTTPYVLAGEAKLKDAIQPESMVSDYGLEIVHEKAVSLNTRKKQVKTDQGNFFDYDYLVIATGATPVLPNIKGADLPGIYTIRNSDDIKSLQVSVKKAKKAVVVGAGIIGIEMAGALKSLGLEVDLVEMSGGISQNLADTEFADKITALLTDSKINIRFNTEVQEIKALKGVRKSLSVKRDGKTEELEADVIIFSIGVRPNLDILNGTNIRMTKQGIVVDNKMRTNIKNIFACGDCCVPLSAVTGEAQPSALASSAIQQSKIVGFQMAGFPIKYNGSTGAFAFETLGKQYACAGLTEARARERFKMVVVGRAVTTDLYQDLPIHQPIEIKLIFAGPKMRLVGYQAFGRGLIASAELASFAIGLKLSILAMLKFNYIAHPSMTPWPFMNPIIMATEDAMGNIMTKIKLVFGRK